MAGRSRDEHAEDFLLRSGVERQFEVAGEAMSVLRGLDPESTNRVPNAHEIVGMRNILIHSRRRRIDVADGPPAPGFGA